MPNLPSIPDIAKQVALNKTDILSIQNILPTITNEISKQPNGWWKDKKTGFIYQWGYYGVVEGVGTDKVINLPIAFSDNNYHVQGSWYASGSYISQPVQYWGVSRGAFSIGCGLNAPKTGGISWIASGY